MNKYWGVLALACSLTIGCTRDQRSEARRDTNETAAEARREANEASERAREAWNREVSTRLDQLDREIDEAEANAKEAARRGKIKTEAEYRQRVAELKELRRDAREQYDKARGATAEAWEDMKEGTRRAIDKLDRAWDRFKADIRST